MAISKAFLLTSAAMVALVPGVSIAQTATAPASASASTSAELEGDPIVVTGLRASIKQAQDVKRDASSVIEAITAEDIGKFTDSSLADALQRVPGVSISRNYRGQDQGDGVTIRGLGRDYVQTTVNGRELLGNPDFFGGSGRNFDFGAIPPDILGSILIYKSPTAGLVESGLAGEIDLQTIKPLDTKSKNGGDYFGSLTAAGFYDQRSTQVSPQINGIVGGKFFNNTLGVYLAGVYSREKTRVDQLYNYTGVFTLNFANPSGPNTVVPNAVGPNGFGNRIQDQNLKRDSYAAGLQWRPSDRFELNADFLYYQYTIALQQRNSDYIGPGFVGKFGSSSLIQPGGVILQGNNIVYYDSTKITGGGTPYQRAGLLNVNTPSKAWNYGLNAKWNNGSGFTLSADGAYEKTEYFQFWRGFYGTNDLSGGTQSTYDIRDRDLPLITFSGPAASNISNPDSYSFAQGLFSFQSFARNKRYAGRADAEYEFSNAFTLRAGARYVETTTNYINAIGLKNGPALKTDNFFSGVDVPPGYTSAVPRANLDAICRDNPVYCNSDNRGKGSFVGDFPTSTAGKPGDLYSLDPSNSYFVRERKTSFYGEAAFKGSKVLGNVGLRAVRIETLGKGFQGVQFREGNQNGPPTPSQPAVTNLVTDNAGYWRLLPTANLTVKPADNINLRFSVARTITPAQYSVLAPRGTAIVITPDATGGASRSVFNGGNTQLKPTSVWNFDITGEYYTPTGGAVILSAYYKDVKDLVQTSTLVGTVPGQGTREFEVTSSQNTQSGKVYGFELGVNQPLSMLPGALGGLGVQANYTFTKTETTLPGVGKIPFLGNSKHQLNTNLYYDRNGWNARLAFFYRSKEFQQAYFAGTSRFIEPQYSLDFFASKEIIPNVQLRLNLINLTGKDVREVSEDGSGNTALQNFYERPRTLLLGVRLSF